MYQRQAVWEEEQSGQDVQDEADDKVNEWNQQASKYVETLALLHANFERI